MYLVGEKTLFSVSTAVSGDRSEDIAASLTSAWRSQIPFGRKAQGRAVVWDTAAHICQTGQLTPSQPWSQGQAALPVPRRGTRAAWELCPTPRHTQPLAAHCPPLSMVWPLLLHRWSWASKLVQGCTKSLLVFRLGRCLISSVVPSPESPSRNCFHSYTWQANPNGFRGGLITDLFFIGGLFCCLGKFCTNTHGWHSLIIIIIISFYAKKYYRCSPSRPVHCRWNSFGPWSECNGCTQKQV